MIKVYPSAKLRAKLPLNENGTIQGGEKCNPPDLSPVPNNPLSYWHAHLIILQRRQCVVMVHDVSRFAVFLPCLTKKDFASLDWHFSDVLMNTFLQAGLPSESINNAAKLLTPLCFDHRRDRSVQGTLNQMTQDLEHRLWFDQSKVEDLLPYSTSAWLSDRPCNVKGQKDCVWPIKAMAEMLLSNRH